MAKPLPTEKIELPPAPVAVGEPLTEGDKYSPLQLAGEEGLAPHAETVIPKGLSEEYAYESAYPPTKSNAPYLRCAQTGALYPNIPPFNAITDMLVPYFPPVAAPPPTPVAAEGGEDDLL